MKYWPFGATRSGSTIPSNYAYTGQETQTYTTIGAYNYKARFYSTMLGRFISADPVSGENRYAYVSNNPLKFIDPTGFDSCQAPSPCPAPVPSPAESDPITACAQNLIACLTWSYTADYGTASAGFIITMGFRQSYADFLSYSNFIMLFWEKFKPECTGAAAAGCMTALGEMLRVGGEREAFLIFGVMMIETYPDGLGPLPPPEGLLDRVLEVHLDGYDTLDWAMRHSGVPGVGVIGFSSGAGTVSQWYANHPDALEPFFLIEPYVFVDVFGRPFPDIDFQRNVYGHRSFRGEFPAYSCAGGAHCTHNSEALSVMHSLMPYLYSYP